MQIATATNHKKKLNRRELILLAFTCFIIFLTRLPWITTTYGTDPDSYRVVTAARHIANTGEYIHSRSPGFPAYEYLISFLPKTTSIYTNGLSALFSCFAFLFFVLIARYFNIKNYLILACAFAFTPIIYLNSISTTDYIVATAFILAATYHLLISRYLIAGLLLGVAIGCRITSGAMLLPLLTWLFLQKINVTEKRKKILVFTVTTFLIGGFCFLPVINTYGLTGITFSEIRVYPSIKSLFTLGVLNVWGTITAIGFIGLILSLPMYVPHMKKAFLDIHTRQGLLLSSTVVGIYAVAFLRLPEDAGYLIPTIPFVLLAIGLITPSYFIKCLAIFIFISSFIGISPKNSIWPGPILMDNWIRTAEARELTKTITIANHLPATSIIVAGYKLPQINLALEDAHIQNNSQYTYMINHVKIYQDYINNGTTVYFLPSIDTYNLNTYGIDLKKLGAQPLYRPEQY